MIEQDHVLVKNVGRADGDIAYPGAHVPNVMGDYHE